VLHEQFSRAYIGAVDEHRAKAKLRVEINRSLRSGRDAEAAELLAQLSEPDQTSLLDEIDDHGFAPNWGTSK
jgi:hypothetical protein